MGTQAKAWSANALDPEQLPLADQLLMGSDGDISTMLLLAFAASAADPPPLAVSTESTAAGSDWAKATDGESATARANSDIERMG